MRIYILTIRTDREADYTASHRVLGAYSSRAMALDVGRDTGVRLLADSEPQRLIEYLEASKIEDGRRLNTKRGHLPTHVVNRLKMIGYVGPLELEPFVAWSRTGPGQAAIQEWAVKTYNMTGGPYDILEREMDVPPPHGV